MKGWIALDIDGTITLDKYSVPEPVIAFLKELHLSGWRIALATGRAFVFAAPALDKFDFPFILMPQNGSVAIEMPKKTALFKRYLSKDAIPLVDEAYDGIDSDFLVYSGFDHADRCYWRPRRHASDDLEYVDQLQKRERETLAPVERFEEIPFDEFPLIKCFGPDQRMKKVAERLRKSGKFQVTKIRDVFHDHYSILLVTAKSASKGESLQEVIRLKGRGEKVIAAGDDENDRSLLEAADVKIAMAHAPVGLQEIADFIAPPTKEHGIIRALKMCVGNERN